MANEQPDDGRHGESAADILRRLVIECRSSVKFDLLHYEKMARAYGNIGARVPWVPSQTDVLAADWEDVGP
jgi:hypothetical protein